MIQNIQKESLQNILAEAYDPDLELCGRWIVQKIVSFLEKDTSLPVKARTAVLAYLTSLQSTVENYTIPSLVVIKNVEQILRQHNALYLLTKS